MRSDVKILFLSILVAGYAIVFSGCASKGKQAAATDQAKAVEAQPTAEDLARQQQEEKDRAKQAELDRMRKEEEERVAQQKLPQNVQSGTPTASTRRGSSFIDSLETVYFDFDRSELTSQSREILKKDAQVIKNNGESGPRVVVEGHCDERGTTEYNLALGERRAISAKKYLVSLGVGENRMLTVSYGEEKPVDPAHNKDAWAKNRRVQFSQE